MDLFLMDLILKGEIPIDSSVLDAGCGEGRNAIYFVREGYEYLGVDVDETKIQLAQYLSNNISTSRAKFEVRDFRDLADRSFDLILCSRVLHFAESETDFLQMWDVLANCLATKGLIYITMDSVIENTLGNNVGDGKYEFPDGAVRFSLTSEMYQRIKKGFKEVVPLRTLIQNETRAQSFFLLRKS